MARDFEDSINFDQMDDADIRDLVRQRLDEDERLDVDAVDIAVEDGRVVVEGRVGTEQERQLVEQVLTGFGTERYENNVVVDEAARAERSEAADIARIEDAAATDGLGDGGRATSDTAEHLADDTSSELYGTRDMRKAIEGGLSYTPPDGPIQEGIGGEETH